MTASAMIRSFVERIEQLNEEIKATNTDKRDVFAEAKGNGLDIAALKEVVRRRSKDPSQLSEHEAIVDTYFHACRMIGTPIATRVHAHEHEQNSPTVSEPLPTGAPLPSIPEDLGIPGFLKRDRAEAAA